METIKFNENETFEVYFGLSRAIYHMEKDLKEWEELNEKGGFKSIIEERQKSLNAIKKLYYCVKDCKEFKIEGI